MKEIPQTIKKTQNWNKTLSDVLVPNTVILACYILLAIGGNIVVLYVYKVRMKSRVIDRYFIPFLAATDLLAATICASMAIAENLMQVMFFNTYLCKIWWTFSAFVTFLSVFILLLIAVQRYLKVVTPSRRQMDLKFNRIALLCVLIVSAALAGPTPIFYGSVHVETIDGSIQGMRCTKIKGENKVGFLVYGSVLGLLATTVIMTLTGIYLRIGWAIFIQVKRNKKFSNESMGMKKVTNGTNGNNRCDSNISGNMEGVTNDRMDLDQHAKLNKRIMHKFTLMLMIITFIFLVCYIPKIALLLVEAIDPGFWDNLNDANRATMLFVYRMYIINNISNPFVYAFLDTKFKTELRSLCNCKEFTIN